MPLPASGHRGPAPPCRAAPPRGQPRAAPEVPGRASPGPGGWPAGRAAAALVGGGRRGGGGGLRRRSGSGPAFPSLAPVSGAAPRPKGVWGREGAVPGASPSPRRLPSLPAGDVEGRDGLSSVCCGEVSPSGSGRAPAGLGGRGPRWLWAAFMGLSSCQAGPSHSASRPWPQWPAAALGPPEVCGPLSSSLSRCGPS